MKVKDNFIQRVLREGRVITPDYLYFIESFESAMQGEIKCVYRTRNKNVFFYQDRLNITSYEVIGCYDIDGKRI